MFQGGVWQVVRLCRHTEETTGEECRRKTGNVGLHVFIYYKAIDGSTDRCCFAIVTNERALLSGSDQPIQNLGQDALAYYACQTGEQTFKDRHICAIYGA